MFFMMIAAGRKGRMNFRIGWFRIEILPRFKIVFDARRTVVGDKKKRRKK